MKEYICVQVSHCENIAETTEEFIKDGWHLHTYQATGHESTDQNSHFLLFERDSANPNQ